MDSERNLKSKEKLGDLRNGPIRARIEGMRNRLRYGAILHVACAFALTSGAFAERSTDGDEELLPIFETREERALMAGRPLIVLANDPPPVAPIRNVGEYETCTGVLIRYPLGIGYGLIREMSEDVTVHVVVSSENLNAAISNFVSNGVDTSRVDWVVEPSNSIWTRDYGPWFAFDGNGDQVILDHFYNRTARPDDNVIPIALGQRWGIPVVTHDLWHAGGNYMTEGHGLSFSSNLVWDENWPDTPQQIADFFFQYYGVDTYNVLPDISIGGIHHIDTWAKLLDEETILMKQVATSHEDYDRIEDNVLTVSGLTNKYGRPFHIVRVTCPPIPSGNVAAYTNSLILNKKVLMPTFGLATADAAALQVYRDAMPGYEVIGFSGGWLTDDALHCRVIGITDRYLLRVDHDRVQHAPPGQPIPIEMYADDRSEAGIDMSATKLYWRPVGATPFNAVSFVAGTEPDWYRAQIPSQVPGAHVEYYVTARDQTGRVASKPRGAPSASYRIDIDTTTGSHPPHAGTKLTLTMGPSPFRYRSTARFRLTTSGATTIAVYDVRGRKVATLLDRALAAGDHEVEWMGRDASGVESPSGVYFVVLENSGERITRRVVLLR